MNLAVRRKSLIYAAHMHGFIYMYAQSWSQNPMIGEEPSQPSCWCCCWVVALPHQTTPPASDHIYFSLSCPCLIGETELSPNPMIGSHSSCTSTIMCCRGTPSEPRSGGRRPPTSYKHSGLIPGGKSLQELFHGSRTMKALRSLWNKWPGRSAA